MSAVPPHVERFRLRSKTLELREGNCVVIASGRTMEAHRKLDALASNTEPELLVECDGGGVVKSVMVIDKKDRALKSLDVRIMRQDRKDRPEPTCPAGIPRLY